MKKMLILSLAAVIFIAGCKRESLKPSIQPTLKIDDSNQRALTATAANAFRGVNWFPDSDAYSDRHLVLTGLAASDSYATVESKASNILSGIITQTSANIIRIPINYSTSVSPWWDAYKGVIDEAVSKGMNVIIGYWEGTSSKDGYIDDTTQFWSMWQTVVNTYQTNPHVYFEIMNEPHGYTLSAWTTICADWLSRYPNVPRGQIFVDGTGYADNVTGVGADSRFANCLLSIHDYSFYNSALTTAAGWENQLSSNVGSYGNRTVLTEYGDFLNTGINYTGAIGGNNDIAYFQGMTNEVRTLGMGSVATGVGPPTSGPTYALLLLGGSSSSPTLTLTNASALSRIQYGWGIGAGGTDTFYSGAYYRFLNLNSGQALDVSGASTSNGASIIQWPQNGANNQQWRITANGSYYKITNRNSGDLVDVGGASKAPGAAVVQWLSNGGNNQQWQLTSISPGVYKVINRNSGYALDINSSSTAVQSVYSGANSQQWQIVQQ